MKKRLVTLLLPVALTLCFAWNAAAAIPLDVGNEVDYGGGDWGGGWDSGDSWDSSDSWDSDGGDTYFFFGGSDSDDDDSDGGDMSMTEMLVVVAVVVIIAFVLVKLRTQKKSGGGTHRPVRTGTNPPRPGNHEAQIVPAVTAIDAAFSKDAFIGFAKETFMTLQQAWTERDWEKIRPLEKEELYQQHAMQLQEYVRNGQINVVERVNVNQTYLHKYQRDAQYEYLTVALQARLNDYVIDEKTRAVVKGDPDREFHMMYLMTFMRRRGVLTKPAGDKTVALSCPHCGAAVQTTSAGRCEYCDSIIKTGDFDWVLAVYNCVRPGTALDERGVILENQ